MENQYVEETGSLQPKASFQQLHQLVHEAISDDELITQKLLETEDDSDLTFGQRLADRVASFGGSWTFILLFGGIITVWIGLNTFLLLRQPPFDPYPFILLNLVLSCLAALQAPVIMMSQNRQESKDRRRAQNDYAINLKAEIEIQKLHEKLDALLEQMPEILKNQREQAQIFQQPDNEDSPLTR